MNVNQNKQLNREEKSRTEHSARNTTVAMFAKVFAILLGFCTRVVFTHTLSEEYVGINGLFIDIVNVLSLSELGIGTAIAYALYKPIAEKNIEKQKSLMLLYKKFYRIVAGVVLAAGLLVLPFMDVLIKNRGEVEDITVIYLMYLANAVLSYLLVYKRTLIEAYQLSYIGVLYQTFFLIIQNLVQMLVLLTTKNFTLFLAILIICTLLSNLGVSAHANRLYPFLKDKQIQPLSKGEKQGIYQNIRAMLMHKVGNVVVNSTDNLLISSMVGIVSVGKYSNYYLIIGSIRQILEQMFQGITASVGNLGVKENKERVKRIFETSFFIGQWMFGFATICLFELLTPFVEVSFGSQYIFEDGVTFVLCLNFYFTGMRQATLVFRDSLGLFRYDRYKALAEALINLVVSIILGLQFGIIGIFIGTLCSTITTSLWVEPYMLYKHRLQAPVSRYFLKYGANVVVTGIAWFITDCLCAQVVGGVVMQWVLRLTICIIVPNLLYLLVYGRSKEFLFILDKAKQMLLNWTKKKKVSAKKEEAFFSKEEEALFQLIRQSLFPASEPESRLPELSEEEWELLIQRAEKHAIVSMLYTELCEKQQLPEHLKKKTKKVAEKIVMQQYRLLFISKYLSELLTGQDISVVVLKGVTVGTLYPVPELRKSGDVDLLLMNPEEFDRAQTVLKSDGFFVNQEQSALHHVCFSTAEGIEIELHTMLAEPFDNEKTNILLQQILKEINGKTETKDVMGVSLPVLPGAYYGFELLLHMLQHFLRSGFGLKLLCDWVLYWQKELTAREQDTYLELVERTGLKGFSDVITMVCVRFLGLDESKIQWMKCPADCPAEEFMRETLDAEEFGKSSRNRMVVMRGTGVFDYVREFHHQMRLNFPKAGKCFLLWPVLWGVTLARFLRNNRKIRNTSTKSILKEATRRSRMMKELRLFR